MSDAQPALGTVQWGLPYGIANATGQAGPDQVSAMIALARSSGIDTLDTARAYGESESVLGREIGDDPSFHVVTKTAPGLLEGPDEQRGAIERLQESLRTSRELLDRPRLDTVLLHRPEQRIAYGGALWEALQRAQDQDRIGRIGVSALTPEDAFAALEDPAVSVMQVASSLLDRRLHDAGFFQRALERDIEVHVRSVFLQGSAFFCADQLPPALGSLEPSIRRLDTIAETFEVSRPVLFWAWARQLGASRLLVGCERVEQLREHLEWFAEASALGDAVAEIAAELPSLGPEILDPSRWS